MLHHTFVKPQYGARCFADLPKTIKHLLTQTGSPALAPEVFGGLPQSYDTVIFLFVDAFGWRFFERYADDYPFLQQFVKHGVIEKLTSQFPSTTSAHVTCIHTGLPPAQSGVYEWTYYEPQLDAIMAPLLFSFSGASERDNLNSTDIDPRNLYPTRTLYHDLNEHGVTANIFQFSAYAHSTYSKIVFDGANVSPFATLPEALVNLAEALTQAQPPSYFFLYFGAIDAICHEYGPNAPQFDAEVDAFLTIMDRLFFQKTSGKLKNTLLMLTADHGHVEVDPNTTIYLNTEPEFAGVETFLKANRYGELLVPSGSARDLFLYIKDGHIDEAQAFLASRLEGRADVAKVDDLIEPGYFGPTPVSEVFKGRVGDLVILPYRHESVWWYKKGRFEQNFYGHHGGLTPQEMEIPLLLYDFS